MAQGQHVRARRHKAYMFAIGGVAVFALAYLIVVSLIGTGVVRLQQPAAPPPAGIGVSIIGTKVDAQKPSLDAYVVLKPDASLVDETGALLRPIEITIEPSLNRELIYRAGRQPTVATIALPLIGDLQNFPFDTYSTRLRVTGFVLDGDDAPGVALPLAVTAEVRDPGWHDRISVTPEAGWTSVLLEIERAGATKTISIMLLSFMVALAVVAATFGRKD